MLIENTEIERVTDFCYLESMVSENGGTTLDVSRNQKAQGTFAKLQKAWQSTPVNSHKDKKFSMLLLNLCFCMAVKPSWSQMN
jgi:hypothetical protein